MPPCLLARRKVHLGGRSAIEEEKNGEERRVERINWGRGKGEEREVGGAIEWWRKGRKEEFKWRKKEVRSERVDEG